MLNVQIKKGDKTAAVTLLNIKAKPTVYSAIIKNMEPVEYESAAITKLEDIPKDITAEALVQGNPEINLETTGMPFKKRCQVYVNSVEKIQDQFNETENVFDPSGTLKTTRPLRITEPNTQFPIKISDKYFKPEEIVKKFVFNKVFQVTHTDSLGFDFLHGLAKELQEKGMVKVGGGAKGTEPLILRRKGLPQQAFLRGTATETGHCITLYLTNMELKKPQTKETVVTAE